MADFKIVSADDERWVVRLADVTREHAESVLTQLKRDDSVPDNLRLIKKSLFRRF